MSERRRTTAHFGDPPQAVVPILPLVIGVSIGLAAGAALLVIHLLEHL